MPEEPDDYLPGIDDLDDDVAGSAGAAETNSDPPEPKYIDSRQKDPEVSGHEYSIETAELHGGFWERLRGHFSSMNSRRVAAMVAGAAVLGTSIFVLSDGRAGPDEDAANTAPAKELDAPTRDEPTEDLEAIAASPEFFDCPIGYQLDIIGRLLSGKDGEQPELVAKTADELASNLTCTKYSVGSHVFTLTVEGDGETLSMAENTSYQVRFVVNNEWPVNEYYDDTGFDVAVEWNRLAKQFVGVVRDRQGNRLGNDSDVTIEWLGPSTLQVIVDVSGLDVDVNEMRTEVNVFGADDNDVRLFDHFDVAIWRAES